MKLKIKSADTAVPEKEITPADGEKIPIQPGDTIQFPEETPVAAVPRGDDLAVFFDDGSSVVLEGFFSFGPGETPPQLDLGEGKSFKADTDFQSADGLVVIIFGEAPAGDILGYEPFGLSDLATLGFGEDLTNQIADFLQEGGLVEGLDDIGVVFIFEYPTIECFDGGIITGAGNISGTSCSETLIATRTADNMLYAFGGDDLLLVLGGDDVENNIFKAGTGNDRLYAISYAGLVTDNFLYGGPDSGNDTLVARTTGYDVDVEENTLVGGAGDDSLLARSSDDSDDNTLVGGEGDDVLTVRAFVDSENNSLTGDGGADTLNAIAGIDVYDNTMKGGDGNDFVFIFAGDEVYENELFGGAGADTLFVTSAGVDTLYTSTIFSNTLSGGEGTDTLSIFGRDDVRRNSLLGGDGADSLYAGAEEDLNGNTLRGGAEDDRILAVAVDNAIANRLFGDDGADDIRVRATGAPAAPGVPLRPGFADDNLLDGGAGADNLIIVADDDIRGNTLAGGASDDADTLELTSGDDAIRNILRGGDGRDSLLIGVPGDTMAVGPGDGASLNSLFGDGGDDRVVISVPGEVRGNLLAGGEGSDIVLAESANSNIFGNGLFGGDDIVSDTGADVIAVKSTQFVRINILNGGGGNDSLSVEAGLDATLNRLLGEDGDDTIRVTGRGIGSNVGTNTLGGGAGNDVLVASATRADAAAVSNTLTGDEGMDTLLVESFRDAHSNILSGGDDADSLLVKGLGYDAQSNELSGDGGADKLRVEADGDVRGNLLRGGEGDDMLVAESADFYAFGNRLLGDGGADTLEVNANFDVTLNDLFGGDGNDMLAARVRGGLSAIVSNSLRGGEGNDLIELELGPDQTVQNALDLNLLDGGGEDLGTGGGDSLRLFGAGDITEPGGATNIEVFDVANSEANNILLSPAQVSAISGGGDTLRVMGDGSGALPASLDQICINEALWHAVAGAAPGFTLFEDNAGNGVFLEVQTDLIVAQGTGINTLISGAGVVGLTVDGTFGNDTLAISGADPSANTLNGGAGRDRLVVDATNQALLNVLRGDDADFCTGDDTLVVLSGGDALDNVLEGGAGLDSLLVRATGGDVEANRLEGGSGDDRLESSATASRGDVSGNTLIGGDGDDFIEASTSGDGGYVYDNILEGGAGDDTLVARTAMADAQLFGNFLAGGDGSDSLVADSGYDLDNNTLSGGAGVDFFLARAADDATGNSLSGGGGADAETLAVSAADDADDNVIDGGGGADSLLVEADGGDAFGNVLRGGAGEDDDILAVKAGDDSYSNTLDGGEGSDSLFVRGADDVTLNSLFGGLGPGVDTLAVNAARFAFENVLDGGAGADSLRITSTDDADKNRLFGGNAEVGDTLTVQNDILIVNTGNDAVSNSLDGGDGADRLLVEAAEDASLNSLFGGTGDDTLLVTGQELLSKNTLVGGDGNDSLGAFGYGGNYETLFNSLDGGAGRDTLMVKSVDNATGNRLLGGDGGDSLRIESLYSVYNSVLEGGGDEGNDTLGILTDEFARGNILLGGDGDDLLKFEINTAYQSIQVTLNENTLDGGEHGFGGADTLQIIADGDIAGPGKVRNIEVLDVTNSLNNEINLDTLAVRTMTGDEDSLRILGDGPGDTVVVDPAQWSGPTEIDGFSVFEDLGGAGVFLIVQNDLTIVGPVAPAPLAGESDEGALEERAAMAGSALLAPGSAVELDFDALASSGPLPGGEAGTGFGSPGSGGFAVPLVAEELLDVTSGSYAAAIAAVDKGFAGTGTALGGSVPGFAPAWNAQGAAPREIAVPPVEGTFLVLDIDVPPDDGAGFV